MERMTNAAASLTWRGRGTQRPLSHEDAAPTAGLGIGAGWQVNLVLITVHKIGPRASLPLVHHLGHRYNADLVTLAQDLLIQVVGGVAGHQLGRGHLDDLVVKCIHGEDLVVFLLEGDLAGDLADEVFRHVELLDDVLGGVDPPGDGELDVAADVGAALAGGAAHLTLRLQHKRHVS
jgi:hypothetical protein